LHISRLKQILLSLLDSEMLYNKTSCFLSIEFITEDLKTEHTNIKTIYKENQHRKYLHKLLKHEAEGLGSETKKLNQSGGKRKLF